MHNLHFSGFSLFKMKKENHNDFKEYKSNPAFLDKLLIINYIMLEEKERLDYIIEA